MGGLIPPFRYFYLGALITLTVGVDLAAGGHIRIFVDNQGAVDIFRKGHSTACLYTSTVAKAIFEVAQATGVQVTVEKVRRCSNRGAYTADQIAKGHFAELRRMMPLRQGPWDIPRSIVDWIKDPKVNMHWSKEILVDLEKMGIEVVTPY